MGKKGTSTFFEIENVRKTDITRIDIGEYDATLLSNGIQKINVLRSVEGKEMIFFLEALQGARFEEAFKVSTRWELIFVMKSGEEKHFRASGTCVRSNVAGSAKARTWILDEATLEPLLPKEIRGTN